MAVRTKKIEGPPLPCVDLAAVPAPPDGGVGAQDRGAAGGGEARLAAGEPCGGRGVAGPPSGAARPGRAGSGGARQVGGGPAVHPWGGVDPDLAGASGGRSRTPRSDHPGASRPRSGRWPTARPPGGDNAPVVQPPCAAADPRRRGQQADTVAELRRLGISPREVAVDGGFSPARPMRCSRGWRPSGFIAGRQEPDS
jgi:hypothetical protein